MKAPDPTQGIRQRIKVLTQALREATALGAQCRISGAEIVITTPNGPLPEALLGPIERERHNGFLWSWLGADEAENEAIGFAEKLGVEPVLIETEDEAYAAIAELIAPTLGIDIETTPDPHYAKPRPAIEINVDGSLSGRGRKKHDDPAGLDPHRARIATLQLYGGGTKCFVFRNAALDLIIASKWLREKQLVAHNTGFELKFLRHHSRPVPGAKGRPIDCTMQASGLLIGVGFGGEGRSLANASKALLDLEPPKALQTSDWGAKRLSWGQLCYAASDAVLAQRLWPRCSALLEQTERRQAYQLQAAAISAVAGIELKGLGFDQPEHARQVDRWSRDLAAARERYHELTGKAPPATPADISAWIEEVAGDRIADWRRTKNGDLSTAEDDIKWLALSDVPTVKPVLDIIARQTLIKGFGSKLVDHISPATGRIHAHYNIAATKSGRFACSKPNLQQLPSKRAPDFRRCIVPAPGHVLVCCDWSQIEMRALAEITGGRALLAIYEANPPRDIHRETAALICGVAAHAVTDEQRSLAKAVNFGTVFGMGPAKLVTYAFAAYGVELTEVAAKGFLDRFFTSHREVKLWRSANGRKCEAQLPIRIGAGRVVEPGFEYGGKLNFTQYCNLPIQGVCADAMLRALRLTAIRLHGMQAWIVATVHDEILVEASEDDAERARIVLQESMIEAFRETFPSAPYHAVAEAHIGRDWLEAKDGPPKPVVLYDFSEERAGLENPRPEERQRGMYRSAEMAEVR